MSDKYIGEINKKFLYILWGILFIFIVIGSIFDLQISKLVANNNYIIASLLEQFGEVLGYGMITIGFAMITKVFKNSKLKYHYVIMFSLAILGIFIPAYAMNYNFTGENGYCLFTMPKVHAYILAMITYGIIFIFAYYKTDENISHTVLLRNALCIIFTTLLTLLAVSGCLKSLAYRPRFRALAWDNEYLNTTKIGFDYYRNWWEFYFFKKPSWFYELNLKSSFLKSWPSGHSSTSAATLSIPFFASIIKGKTKKSTKIYFYIAIFYTFFVAFSRIFKGAHYLTDISFGIFIETIVMLLTVKIIYFIFKEISKNDQN